MMFGFVADCCAHAECAATKPAPVAAMASRLEMRFEGFTALIVSTLFHRFGTVDRIRSMYWEDILSAIALLAAGGFTVVTVLFVTRTLVPNWREQRLRTKAAEWPTIQAKLDHACVTEYRPSDTQVTYRLDAWFNYTVEGKIYDGMYANPEMRLNDAKRLLKQLNHEPVMITYNPAKPGEYFYEPKLSRRKSA